MITSNQKSANKNTNENKSVNNHSYEDGSSNDLTLISGALLLMADCLGTGILALPHDVQVLGPVWGISFIILNLPINWYAGTILSNVAQKVEDLFQYNTIQSNITDNTTLEIDSNQNDKNGDLELITPTQLNSPEQISNEEGGDSVIDKSTYDFIGLTNALFLPSPSSPSNQSSPTRSHASTIVTSVFYCNIFLVLGNYILVMSHAVRALIGESNICMPQAGLVAATLMFALSQMSTMSKLGQWATIVSLTSLFIVVLQCLYAANANDVVSIPSMEIQTEPHSILRKFAALSSIGFAVGSQKLFLNIRHEMRDKSQAPFSLGICLLAFGSCYVLVCLLAGSSKFNQLDQPLFFVQFLKLHFLLSSCKICSDPPGFLFDAIPKTSFWNRRIGGFFLWLHVAVSYAINSQAINSSIDRTLFHRTKFLNLAEMPRTRWLILTLLTSISSYLVANAIPFFKDLVSFIGALTSVPLTLLLPSILFRRGMLMSDDDRFYYLWFVKSWSDPRDVGSFLLTVFSIVFMLCGMVGAFYSIETDWARRHSPPFACEG